MLPVETPAGQAQVHLHALARPRGAVVLGHGAGGGVGAPDLVAAGEAAVAAGFTVALVEQPYRVTGRRAPPRAPRLDEAWLAVLADLRAGALAGLPLIAGGRSSGARVACRTASETGAAGVLCLAFPLRPAREGAPSRQPELDAVRVPVLVVQGERDPFGLPEGAPGREVVVVPGDHALRRAVPVREAVGAWLMGLPVEGIVTAVSRAPAHAFSKENRAGIRLLAGLGVEGDAHAGTTVRHRSRVARDPGAPNLRQVHLIHGELHDELRTQGFEVGPGDLGENVTTRGLDLLALPRGARLRLGPDAVVELTGLRNPCAQLDRFRPGLMAAVLDRDEDGALVRKAGVMGVVVKSGDVRPGDRMTVELPPPPHARLVRV